jgi:GNAT superfamily N-acetyltransferase
MLPFIRDGDVLTIRPAGAVALNVGDAVVYRTAASRLVAHRIVGKELRSGRVVLVLRGDALSGPGEPVAAGQVLGRVVGIRRGKRVLRLERGARQWATLLWVKTSPLGPGMVRMVHATPQSVRRLLHRLQALAAYRRLARMLIGPHIRCRVATAKDATALSRLYIQESLSDLVGPDGRAASHLDSPEAREGIVIASLMGMTAGATAIHPFPEDAELYPDWWLSGMLVRTRYRGAGIGQRLVLQALDQAARAGATRVNLMVSQQNRAALALYHKMGFRAASIPPLERHLRNEAPPAGRLRILSRHVGP